MGTELESISNLLGDMATICAVLERHGELRRQEIKELASLSDRPTEQELTAVLRTMQAYGFVETPGYKWKISE